MGSRKAKQRSFSNADAGKSFVVAWGLHARECQGGAQLHVCCKLLRSKLLRYSVARYAGISV